MAKNVVKPCYGLSEATLKVTAARSGDPVQYLWVDSRELMHDRVRPVVAGQEGSRLLAGCGMPPLGMDVLVVDPEKEEACPTLRVGEIWISGAAVADGYWNQQGECENVFHGTLDNKKNRCYLKTGDMGFLFNDQLYVTGRRRDRISINGCHQYPRDIEHCAEKAQPLFRQRRSVAFSTGDDGSHELVLIVTMAAHGRRHPRNDELFVPVSAAIHREFGIVPNCIVLTSLQCMDISTTGNVRRTVMKEKYLSDKMDILYQYKPVANNEPQ